MHLRVPFPAVPAGCTFGCRSCSQYVEVFLVNLSPLSQRPSFPRPASPADSPGRRPGQKGQATAEYALVLLGAAALALLLVAWATGSGKIGELFDAVIGQLISKAG
jgi:hypothetical protein